MCNEDETEEPDVEEETTEPEVTPDKPVVEKAINRITLRTSDYIMIGFVAVCVASALYGLGYLTGRKPSYFFPTNIATIVEENIPEGQDVRVSGIPSLEDSAENYTRNHLYIKDFEGNRIKIDDSTRGVLSDKQFLDALYKEIKDEDKEEIIVRGSLGPGKIIKAESINIEGKLYFLK